MNEPYTDPEMISRDEALAMVAAVVERAAAQVEIACDALLLVGYIHFSESAREFAPHIRALTPADARAALDRIKAEAHAAGVREGLGRAAKIAEAHTTQRLIYINPESRKRDEAMIDAIRAEGGE